MRVTTWLLASVLAFSVAGCASKSSSSKSSSPTSSHADGKTMPSVTGKNLQAAEDAIDTAGGDPDKIKVIGGGKLGIVVKSNWQVCSQTPAAGAALSAIPQLTVDRSCRTSSSASSAPASSSPASSGSGPPSPLTLTTSKDLAALLKVGDGCDPPVKAFATRYAGQEIEFDGSVAGQAPHADPYDTRHDYLIGPGDMGANSDVGPNFQFQNVSIRDLHLTGSDTPDSLKVGTKLHIVVEVGSYNSKGCLLELTPVSTRIRR